MSFENKTYKKQFDPRIVRVLHLDPVVKLIPKNRILTSNEELSNPNVSSKSEMKPASFSLTDLRQIIGRNAPEVTRRNGSDPRGG